MPSERSEIPPYFLMAGLLNAYYWMDESLQNHLRAAGLPELSRTQSLVMTNLADGVRRPAELARRIGVSRQAMQQLLVDLRRRNLVVLRPDPTDSRAKIVEYDPRGRQVGVVTMLALERIDRELESRIGKKALEALRDALLGRDWGLPLEASREDLDDDERAPRERPSLEALARRGGRRRRAVQDK